MTLYKNLEKTILDSIKPTFLKTYIINNGWTKEGDFKDLYFIYRHNESQKQLLIPKETHFDDYHRRIFEVLEVIAQTEQRPINKIIDEVFLPQGDIIRFRLVGSEYESGTVPLSEGFNLISGSRKSLFSSALQVISPKKHHQRLRNNEAEEFLNTCRLGQTERGSFITSFVCPLGIRQQELFERNEPSTFTRKVTSHFMKSLYLIKTAIDDDSLDGLADGETPLVSSNFCDALTEMKPRSLHSNLDVSIKFSTRDVIPATLPQKISIRADYFREIEQISTTLRPSFVSRTQTIFAKVDSCLGQPNEEEKMQGEVRLIFLDEGTPVKAKIDLAPEDYQKAVTAHGNNKYVKVVGELRPSSRIGKIQNQTSFDIAD